MVIQPKFLAAAQFSQDGRATARRFVEQMAVDGTSGRFLKWLQYGPPYAYIYIYTYAVVLHKYMYTYIHLRICI